MTCYCRKCKRDMPVGEICPQCGGKLGQSAVRVKWEVWHNPLTDWISWNAVARILLPAFALVAAGIPLAEGCGHKVVADGITNYIGDLPSEDGIVRTRIMCEMNMPHWPTPEMSRQIFEFFSHFSRDRKTGESIYHP